MSADFLTNVCNKQIYTYRLLTDLPPIPDDFLKEIAALYTTAGLDPMIAASSAYAQRQVRIHGQNTKPVFTRRFRLSTDFEQWAASNVVDNFIECIVSHAPANHSGWQAAHTDWPRKFVLLYVLENGGPNCTTCWYRPTSTQVIQSDQNGQTWVCDKDDLETVDSIKLPMNTWAVLNGGVLHGVENIQEDRITIQISLESIDSIKSTQI